MTDRASVPATLVEEVRSGRVVLLLGAGATEGASCKDGSAPPRTAELRDRLSARFLGNAYKNESLSWVAELSVSEASLPQVQDFIAAQLDDLQPATYHLLLPTFRWRGLFSTNFDRLCENTYAKCPAAVQSLVPLISNRDRIDESLRAPSSLGLFKLHGCVTRTHDPAIPLVLSADQYATHRAGREYLFNTFAQWALEYPVVFVGHSGQDADIRSILLEVSREPEVRPRYFMLKPDAAELDIRFWEQKRITVLTISFEAFLRALDSAIPADLRPAVAAIESSGPLDRRLRVHSGVPTAVKNLLSYETELVHPSMPVGNGRPGEFYRGFDLGWYPVANELDVRRKLTDTLLSDVIARADEDRPSATELYAITAEAGAGKSVFLRRLAWEAARDADALVLFRRPAGRVHIEQIRELARVTGQRVFLFTDDATDNAAELASLVERAQRDKLALTVITAERLNTWNTLGEQLAQIVSDTFPLRYLSEAEIEQLVAKLDQHRSLGPALTGQSRSYAVEQFAKRAGRQLLVALHEATAGRPFEDIILDEYREIQPLTAQQLYLTVCVLNRLGVPVRAGLIARVHRIQFAEFKDRLFKPLEKVVAARQIVEGQDYYYEARHPEIAQIVFDRVLNDTHDRVNEYLRIIAALNLAYSTDRDALRGLLRARSVADLFPNHEDAQALFKAAETVGPREPYLFQQRANYERLRPSGNLREALALLNTAHELDPRDTTIEHTRAEVLRTTAESASAPLERVRLRNEARAVANTLLRDPASGRYARHTIAKLAVDDLHDALEASDSTDRAIDELVRRAEDAVQHGLQEQPGDQYLLSTEAALGQLLNDHERAFRALLRAHDANPRDPYIATRLAVLHARRGDEAAALETVKSALDSNRGDKTLNYRYATLLREAGQADADTLRYYYHRAFTDGDSNYEAQFWYARYAFVAADAAVRAESKTLFRQLREAHVAFEARTAIRDTIRSGGFDQPFTGTIARQEATFGFVERDGQGDWIFFHVADQAAQQPPTELSVGTRVAFVIGFNMRGPIALQIEPI